MFNMTFEAPSPGDKILPYNSKNDSRRRNSKKKFKKKGCKQYAVVFLDAMCCRFDQSNNDVSRSNISNNRVAILVEK